MQGIEVKAVVKGEEVTFRECGAFTLIKLVNRVRKLLSGNFLQDQEDAIDSLFSALDNPEFQPVVLEILEAFSDKSGEFFADMSAFTDVENIIDAIKGSDFEKVVRRFFTKLTNRQQTTE